MTDDRHTVNLNPTFSVQLPVSKKDTNLNQFEFHDANADALLVNSQIHQLLALANNLNNHGRFNTSHA